MNTIIGYLEDLSAELVQLSGLCNVLSCAWEGPSRPKPEDIANSYETLRNVLSGKAAEIDETVSEWCESQAEEPVNL